MEFVLLVMMAVCMAVSVYEQKKEIRRLEEQIQRVASVRDARVSVVKES